jgi:hypothetical protein
MRTHTCFCSTPTPPYYPRRLIRDEARRLAQRAGGDLGSTIDVPFARITEITAKYNIKVWLRCWVQTLRCAFCILHPCTSVWALELQEEWKSPSNMLNS